MMSTATTLRRELRDAFRRNWPEYLLEAFGLGLFMVSATGFAVLLFHPASPIIARWPDPFLRGALMGLAMGGTAMLNAYSPWGRRSGAHLNPAVTLTFARLGRISRADVVGYVAGQFLGGVGGMGIAVALFHRSVIDPSVNYVATVPGPSGVGVAFAAEAAISFLLMLAVLVVSNTPAIARFTGVVAGLLVASYITLETPLSGMSMNPARTVGSDVWAGRYPALWLYFAAPLLGMLLAGELYRRRHGVRAWACAKYDHDLRYRCHFCGHPGER